ncbi:MAG: transporter related protein [Acidobacteriaceae bacterium]|nr:transporter related protein [Acidobacteriaceae bacterium]
MSFDNAEPLLEVKIQHRVGVLTLNVAFSLTQPWTVLFGPSGSGKTTVLRAIAGFVKPDAGRISRGDSVLVDGAVGTFVPAHARPVRSAGQSARLFPHISVRGNVLYGADGGAGDLAAEVMALFRVAGLGERMPRELSGGERERVSAARAVVAAASFGGPGKALLLLDEPFAGLDTALRDELLVALRNWLAGHGIPVLSVTHDVGEAFQLGAEVIRIADGRVVAQGPVGEVLAEERMRLLGQLQS